MKSKPLQISGETVHPGEHLSLALPLPELFSCAPVYMPIKVVHGKEAGPCLLITAAMHGNELNGTEIINRLLELPELKRLKGTLIAIPVLNVYGLMTRSRTLPGGIDLDTCFPGSEDGTLAARMAYTFCHHIFDKVDLCIDLQTGCLNYANLPQVYINFQDEKAKELAQVFNAPVISHVACEKGMLRTVALNQKKPFLLYEAGEAMHFDESAITVGLQGIVNVMRKLQMLPDKVAKKKEKQSSFFAEKNIWIHAPTSGISHSQYALGQQIKKNEVLSVIKDPFGAADNIMVMSPEDAIIVGKNNLPLVYEGEALFQLAIFPKMEHTADYLENWQSNELDSSIKL